MALQHKKLSIEPSEYLDNLKQSITQKQEELNEKLTMMYI